MTISLEKLDRRIPKWELGALEARNCPFCDARGEERFRRPDQLFLRNCPVCGTWFVSPSPAADQLARFYRDYDRMHRNMPSIEPHELAREYRRTDPMHDYRFRVMTRLMNMEKPRVLDIGFGRGFYLHAFQKRGATVTGLELDSGAVALVREGAGIDDLRLADFLEFDTTERFDLILMLDLVEHLLRPWDYLARARELLSSGGVLVIFTPNGECAHQSEQPVIFRVDLEHMQYLTEVTCRYLADHLNMEVVHLESYGKPYLENIVDVKDRELSWKRRQARLIARLPGIARACQKIRSRAGIQNPPDGEYHLFFALMKPAGSPK